MFDASVSRYMHTKYTEGETMSSVSSPSSVLLYLRFCVLSVATYVLGALFNSSKNYIPTCSIRTVFKLCANLHRDAQGGSKTCYSCEPMYLANGSAA